MLNLPDGILDLKALFKLAWCPFLQPAVHIKLWWQQEMYYKCDNRHIDKTYIFADHAHHRQKCCTYVKNYCRINANFGFKKTQMCHYETSAVNGKTWKDTWEYRRQWHKYLLLAVLNHYTTYHSSIGCESTKVFHGRILYNKPGKNPNRNFLPTTENAEEL